jgi:hypothetical protein
MNQQEFSQRPIGRRGHLDVVLCTFDQQRSMTLGFHGGRLVGGATGEVRVYRSNGYLCAMTVPKRQGGNQWMSVSVRARGGRPVVDEGLFAKRAGPVTVHAGRRQVWIKGAVGRGSVSSGWIRC